MYGTGDFHHIADKQLTIEEKFESLLNYIKRLEERVENLEYDLHSLRKQLNLGW